MTRAAALAVLTAVLALAGLAGCSSGSDDQGSSTSFDAGEGGEAPQAGGDAARAEAAAGAAEDGAFSADLDAGVEQVDDEVPSQAIISTGAVAVRTEDVEDGAFEVQKIVDAAGGRVTDSETRTDDDGTVRTSRMVLRVPAERFEETMASLESDVGDLESSSSQSEDVTTQVVDNAVRIRVQRRSIERIEVLFDRATSIRDIVNIENELSQRQARLNALLRTQAYLADQTSESTISVSLQLPEEDPAPAEEDDDSGFVAGLQSGWHGLVAVTIGLLTVLGALLPFLVVAAVVSVPVWLVVRRLRRRTPGGAAPAEG